MIFVLSVNRSSMLLNSQLTQALLPTQVVDAIDAKILQWGKAQYDNIRLGTDNSINYISFEGLLLLRDIFVSKLHNADWLCDYSLEQIQYSIFKYTNSNC